MQVVISTRRADVSDRVRNLVEERFARLSRYESRISRVKVTLTNEKNRWEVETLASIDGTDPVHAHAESTDVRTAIDRTVDRMTRQLKRNRSRHKDHQGPTKDMQQRLKEPGS